MQKGITEPHQVSTPLAQKRTHDNVAADHIILKLPKRNAIQARMRIGVIPQIEPGIQPLAATAVRASRWP